MRAGPPTSPMLKEMQQYRLQLQEELQRLEAAVAEDAAVGDA